LNLRPDQSLVTGAGLDDTLKVLHVPRGRGKDNPLHVGWRREGAPAGDAVVGGDDGEVVKGGLGILLLLVAQCPLQTLLQLLELYQVAHPPCSCVTACQAPSMPT